ncbi:MAG TPA: amino acid adenylation domain-containing protein [Vicinamibacterales bacterium]|jgi:aspartate racemase
MKHWVVISLHRLITDLSILGLSFSKLAALYAPYRVGQWLETDTLSSQIGYWRRQLAGEVPALQLFTDRDRPPSQSSRIASAPVTLSADLVGALTAVSAREGVTPFMTLLAAFGVLLQRYSGQHDIVVGAMRDTWRDPEPAAQRTPGNPGNPGNPGDNVARPLPLRLDLSGDPPFRVLLERVRRVALDADANRDVPIAQLQELLQPRGSGHTPLYQVMFGLHGRERTMRSPMENGSAPGLMALSLRAVQQHAGLSGALSYQADAFDAATAAQMVARFQVVLEGAVAQPACRLSQLPLLTEAERVQVFAWSSKTAVEYPLNRCVHDLVESQAQRTPDAKAVTYAGRSISYATLNQRANQVARDLRARGVRPDQPVGVCLERSLELVTSLLGVLKAGGAYVALDPAARPDHLSYMVRDVGMSVLIGRKEQVGACIADAGLHWIDPDSPEVARQSAENLPCTTLPHNLAYTIYTSGTTGTPKGVEVTHRAIVRLVRGLDCLAVQPRDIWLQLSSMSFDLSTLEIWHPLVHGACLAMFPGRFESFQDLGRVLHHERVTSLWLTASLFNAIIDEHPQALSGVRDLVIGGEALSVPHVKRALDLLPATRIVNGYGPTEATTFTHCYSIPRLLEPSWRSIPIGLPIGGTEGWILDGALQPTPIGVPGELYVGGDGLARGYRNQPALTAKKFIPHPFDDTPGARLYATGDRARYLPDGLVEYLGRSDYQVKIRGFRVELEGIEATLTGHPAVRQAVITSEQDDGETRLVGYVVLNPVAKCRISELRAFLESKLPDYMVPSQIIVLDALPLTASGKVDRRALPKSERSAASAGHTDAAPRTDAERSLAAMWAELFHVDRVSVDDNFFELGGHSLLAARLFGRIEQTFGKKLPLSILLRAPTVAQLAATIEEAGHASESALAPIQPHGSKPPLFCVAGIGGSVLGLGTLGQCLGDDQPIYGLRLHPSDSQTYPTVEARAARYLEEVFAVAPAGPYRLAGYSSGGIIAFEMACQLQALGHDVALLAIFDQSPSEPQPIIPFGPRSLVEFFRNLPYWVTDDFMRSGRGEMLGRVRSKARLVSAGMPHPFGRVGRNGGKRSEADIRDVVGAWRFPEETRSRLEAEYRALRTYVPPVYPGRVTLFRARAGPLFRFFPSDMGWTGLAGGGVDVKVVPGSHETMLADPYVRVLAEEMRRCLAPCTDLRT